jgi:hypothetical protein
VTGEPCVTCGEPADFIVAYRHGDVRLEHYCKKHWRAGLRHAEKTMKGES